MDRLIEPKKDNIDFIITSFEKSKYGTATARAFLDNGARIDMDLSYYLEEGEDPLIKADISIDGIRWGSSGTIYTDLSLDRGITPRDVEKCIEAFIEEKMGVLSEA